MEKINLNRHMTWNEIVETYPHKWVGLADINWEGGKILSAIVKYVDDSVDDIFDRQITIGDVEAEYTTPDELWSNLYSGVNFLPTENNFNANMENTRS